MAKGDRKSAFRSSLKAEEQAVQNRFERAETALAKPGKKGASKDAVAVEEKKSVGKVVRDSFSMPADEYATIAKVQDVCLRRRIVTNKSEVVRAGLTLLNKLSDKEIIELIQGLTKVKAGRPPVE